MRNLQAGQKTGVCAHAGHAFTHPASRSDARARLVCRRCGITTEHDTLSFDAKITLVNDVLNKLMKTLNKFTE